MSRWAEHVASTEEKRDSHSS